MIPGRYPPASRSCAGNPPVRESTEVSDPMSEVRKTAHLTSDLRSLVSGVRAGGGIIAGSMRLHHRSALLPLAVLAAASAGCRGHFENPKYDVEERRSLLVPFPYLAVKHGHAH